MKLGDKVRDRVSGFEGTITAHAEYLHMAEQFGVQSAALNEGKPIGIQWFEVSQLEVLLEDG